MTRSELDAATAAKVRVAWSQRLQVPLARLVVHGTCVVTRPGLDAVVVLELDGAVVVVTDPEAVPIVTALDGAELRDLGSLSLALASLHARPLGRATLSYVPTTGWEEPVPVGFAAARPPEPRPAVDADLAAVSADCDPAEVSESGVRELTATWAVHAPNGEVAAVAGFSVWEGGLAQLGVLTHPLHRGHGLGMAVCRAAVRGATSRALVAQWRCREGNTASAALGRSLGAVPFGTQTTVLLES